MNCNLCEKEIIPYIPEFNYLVIDEHHFVNICSECIDKIMKWQSKKYAILFPTTVAKKRFGKNKP